MYRTARPQRRAGILTGILFAIGVTAAAAAQTSTGGFVTGDAMRAYEQWRQAMQALLERDDDQAEQAFAALLEMEPSPMRLALLEDHLATQSAYGGAVLLLEQDYEAGTLGEAGRRVVELLQTGRERLNQANDGFYFSQLGRFDVAQANFAALLNADPDPVALLEFVDRKPRRKDILVRLFGHPIVGQSAHRISDLLQEGELRIKSDPVRIKENIERLAGPPRGYENAVAALRDSGEYAIPFMIQYLQDPAQQDLTAPILRALPTIDRPAMNPLVQALGMDDNATKRYVIEALGELGYVQAVPYLLEVRNAPKTPEAIKTRIGDALTRLRSQGAVFPADISVADAFYELADRYYNDKPSLAADKRLDTANVWYWRDGLLQNIRVPTVIFNEIMCMRCCEEALQADPGMKPAIALWLAANFRRVAQLPQGASDYTRPDDFPPAAYFAQSAGPEPCLMALARALDDADPAVALGTIDALRRTAGPASLTTDAHGRLPLAEALAYPGRMVRVRAGLTLGHARPTQPFHNDQNLMPVLSEALMLYGGARNALVIDPDDGSANFTAGLLRALGYTVLSDAALLAGLQKVRDELPGIDVIVLASDVKKPTLNEALATLRSEFRFAATPVVIMTKRGDAEMAQELVRGNPRLGRVPVQPQPEMLERTITEVIQAIGSQPITPEVGAELAVDAADVLRNLALSQNPLFDVSQAQPALLAALEARQGELRLKVAQVLGYLGTPAAQEAIAQIALDETEDKQMRISMFAALAEAAKRRGSLLGGDLIDQIVTTAQRHQDMDIREAASQALGALNVPGAPASEIIRDQYRG